MVRRSINKFISQTTLQKTPVLIRKVAYRTFNIAGRAYSILTLLRDFINIKTKQNRENWSQQVARFLIAKLLDCSMALLVEIVVQYYYHYFFITITEHLYNFFSLLLNSVRKHGFLANVFLYKTNKISSWKFYSDKPNHDHS